MSSNDGRSLEKFVAFVESVVGDKGLEITTNKKTYDDDGNQIAEFDIEVRGRIGTTVIAWLIECRDRPSERRAPVSWIEQLVGRRDRFNFSRVTAVSTTGFADGAQAFAANKGIELRQICQSSSEEFEWLGLESMTHLERMHEITSSVILISPDESAETLEAFHQTIHGVSTNVANLKLVSTNEMVSAAQLFQSALASDADVEWFEGLVPEGESVNVALRVDYRANDVVLVVPLVEGKEVRVQAIEYKAKLSVRKSDLPLANAMRYEVVAEKRVVSEAASFHPFVAHGNQWSLEIHRIAETGEQHLGLRYIGKAPG